MIHDGDTMSMKPAIDSAKDCHRGFHDPKGVLLSTLSPVREAWPCRSDASRLCDIFNQHQLSASVIGPIKPKRCGNLRNEGLTSGKRRTIITVAASCVDVSERWRGQVTRLGMDV